MLHSAVTRTPPAPRPLADLAEWESRARLMVKARRYDHVVRVADLAYQIARANRLDADRAYLAGILHDIARDLPDSELLRLAPPEVPIDAAHPLALHGRAARTLLERWGYRDEVVLRAVEDHTTGPRSACSVSACVYVADVSEPGRGVNQHIRELAMVDLEGALALAISSKVHYLQARGIPVHPRTLSAYQGLQERGALPPSA
ncbi:HD domain-containing protein [Deinococcus psychrotolerans]|uniref:bis(5'-nucleosyl)-tetraphosphatase (symmetrical) n=1 Tax=Deinococcus psychrotolerans TaxID=2489213 RepID=A0A3G8YCG3_9DEIO|nr:bis(5'-nucleosyl)-tetraphosphatase (symmetrical) YqeK [Deinococcus psychrotolerans]AZI43008.1 HD domain-containing protein [Deinococcus psychrotolerans]